MLACRISSMMLASTSIVVLLVALTTDYWLVAYGPKHVAHSGLWTECRDGGCFTPNEAKEYIIATRLFLILGSLAALASLLCSASSFMSCPYSIGNNSVVTSFIAFAAGLFTLTALAVYTAESWNKNQDPQIQLTFAWSFYFGWVAVPTLLLTGIFSLMTCLYSPRADYDRV